MQFARGEAVGSPSSGQANWLSTSVMQVPSSSFALRLKLNALLFVQPGKLQTPGGA
jgi:hypothetical protein